MFRNSERKRQQDQARGQLLHSAGDHGMRLARLPPLEDRAERPSRHANLQNQKSIEHLAVDGVRPPDRW